MEAEDSKRGEIRYWQQRHFETGLICVKRRFTCAKIIWFHKGLKSKSIQKSTSQR